MNTNATAKVTASVNQYGIAQIDAYIEVPNNATTIRERATEIGIDVVRKQFEDFANDLAVQQYHILGDQIHAAERKVADADAVIRRVEAANRLLLENPADDLANKLRAVAGELVAAKESKAAAEADLALIRKPATDHFLIAANNVVGSASTACAAHLLAMEGPRDAAKSRLSEACRKVSEILSEAIGQHIVPAILELAAHQAADRSGWHGGKDAVVNDAITFAVGKVPHTVVRRGNYFEAVPLPKSDTQEQPGAARELATVGR